MRLRAVRGSVGIDAHVHVGCLAGRHKWVKHGFASWSVDGMYPSRTGYTQIEIMRCQVCRQERHEQRFVKPAGPLHKEVL